jgi:hypothetical protein
MLLCYLVKPINIITSFYLAKPFIIDINEIIEKYEYQMKFRKTQKYEFIVKFVSAIKEKNSILIDKHIKTFNIIHPFTKYEEIVIETIIDNFNLCI